jgi:hypothetical protein
MVSRVAKEARDGQKGENFAVDAEGTVLDVELDGEADVRDAFEEEGHVLLLIVQQVVLNLRQL